MELSDYRLIRMVRKMRNLTLIQMGEVMQISEKTLSKIECGHIEFTPLYQSKFIEGCKKLNVSPIEIASIKILLEVSEGKHHVKSE